MSVHNEYTGYTFEAFISETYVQLAATGANVLCARALHSESPTAPVATASAANNDSSHCTVRCFIYCLCRH